MSDLTNFFILTLSVFIYDQDINATKNSLEAYYKQSGYERNINYLLDKNISNELRSQIGDVIFITNVIAEKQIVYKLTF